MRRALLQLLGMGTLTRGYMPMRPDQGSSPPPSVVSPSTAFGTLRARSVVIVGTGASTGLFVYNGTPGLGNPPQIAIVNSSATQDPFGNAITTAKILMQANVITETSGIFRTAAASPLMQLDGPHNAFLVYNAASGLAETIAPVGTSDGLGSTVVPGVATYTTTAPFIAIQLFGNTIQFQNASAQGGPWSANGPSLAYTGGANGLTISSGTGGGAVVAAALALVPEAGAGVSAFTGSVALANQAAPSNALVINAPDLFGASGHLKVVSSATGGDGQTYNTERVRQVTTSTQQFTLASAVAITGLSRTLGVGSYHVRLKVFWVPSGVVGSTHTHNFAFTGTATGNVNGQCWQAQAAFAVQQTSLNAGAGNNLTAGLLSPTHVAFAGWTELDADITVTVAGTLTHTITLTTGGDDITTSAGTYWEITPEA